MVLKSFQFRAETPETGLGVLGLPRSFLLTCSSPGLNEPCFKATALLPPAWSSKVLVTLNNQHQQSPCSLVSSHSNFFLQKRQLTDLGLFKYWGMWVPHRAVRAVAVAVHHSWMEKRRSQVPVRLRTNTLVPNSSPPPGAPGPSAGSSHCPSEFCIMGQRLGVSLCWVFSSWES